jgi:hypothetical protein
MPQRIVLAGLSAIALALFAPLATSAVCARESFGVDKANLCTLEKCRFFAPPDEIARISRGVYTEFVGLSINDGTARWLGIDVDNAELVEVSRFAGRRLGNAPTIDTPTKDSYTRETRTDRVRWIDVVRKRSVGQDELSELICAANQLWVAKWIPPRIPPRPLTDVHNEIFLIDREAIKSFGGMGDDPGEAEDLRKLLRSLRDPTWGN